ncbi:MAG: hypothetical protein ACRDIY_14600, partial [Chloroflexota bacterium]
MCVVRQRWIVSLVVAFFLLATLMPLPGEGIAAGSGQSPAGALVAGRRRPRRQLVNQSARPPTDAQCRATLNTPGYSPQEMRRAYG